MMITRTVILIWALAAGSAQAELVPTEWEGGPFVGTSLTLDTATSLEWLDLTYTVGRSYNEVQARLNTDWAGFRIANYWEVRGLFANAGINYIGYAPKDVGEGANMATLINLLGKTGSWYSAGMFDGANVYPQVGHESWFFALLSDQVSTTSYVQGGSFADHSFASDTGTFLVRNVTAVPETSTYAMMLAGLLLVGWSRHQQSRKGPSK